MSFLKKKFAVMSKQTVVDQQNQSCFNLEEMQSMYCDYDQKIYYSLTRKKEDYDFFVNFFESLDNEIIKKEFLKMYMPAETDVLDYGDRSLKFFIDKCRLFNIICKFTIIGEHQSSVKPVQINIDNYKQSIFKKFVNQKELFANDFVVSNWLVINPFIIYNNRLRKGAQHKLCTDVKFLLKNKWNMTLLHNSNSDIRKLLSLCKYLNIDIDLNLNSKIKFKAQIFGISQTFGKINHLVDKVDSKIDPLFEFIEKLNNSSNYVSGIADKISTGLTWKPLVIFMVKLCSAIFLIYDLKINDIKHITSIFILMLPNDVISKFGDFFQILIRAIQGMINKFTVYNTQAEADNENLISSFFKLTVGICGSLFKGMDDNMFNTLNISGKKLKLVSDYIKNSSTIYEYVLKMVEKLIEIIGDKIVKYYGYFPTLFKDSRIENLIDQYNDVVNKDYFNSSMFNTNHAQILGRLYKDLVDEENKLYRKTLKYSSLERCKIFPYLRIMINTLDKIIKQIPIHVLGGSSARRNKPFWLYIHGKPRIGKSAMFQPFIANLLAQRLKLIDEYQEPHNYSYYRNMGDKYWDTYKGQLMIQYNDIMQNVQDDETLNLALTELTQIIDDNPYSLNIAFDNKGQVYCTSRIVISNAQSDIVNMSWVKNKCWSNGDHIFARRNVVVELILNDKYAYNNGLPNFIFAKSEANDLLNCSKFLPIYPKDMYNLKFTEPLSGELLFNFAFDEGVEYILNSAQAYCTDQNQFKDQLYKCFEQTWKTQMFEGIVKIPNFIKELISNQFASEVYYDANEVVQFYENCECRRYLNRYIDQIFEKNYYDLDMDLRYMFDKWIAMHKCYECDLMQDRNPFNYNHLDMQFNDVLNKYFQKHPNRLKAFALKCKNKWFDFMEEYQKIKIRFPLLEIAEVMLASTVITYALTSLISLFKKKDNVVSYGSQSAEGSNQKVKERVRRVRKPNDKLLSGGIMQMYDQQNVDIESIFYSHFATFYLTVQYDDKPETLTDLNVYMHSVCVFGSVFMLPRHFWDRYEDMCEFYKDKKCKLNLHFKWASGQNTTILYKDNCQLYKPDFIHTEDLLFVKIRGLVGMRNLTKFFVKEEDNFLTHACYLYGLRAKVTSASKTCFTPMSVTVSRAELQKTIYSSEEKIEPFFDGVIKSRDYNVPLSWVYYECMTVGGDCGMLAIHTDTKLNCRRIFGMHTAGLTTDAVGISIPIYQEDLMDAFDYFNGTEKNIVMDDGCKYVNMQMDSTSRLFHPLKDLGFEICGEMNSVFFKGKHKKIKTMLPRKSCISKSLVYDIMEKDFGPHKFQPAALVPFLKDGVVISPFLKGMAKMLCYSSMISNADYLDITNHIVQTIKEWPSIYMQRNRKVLTLFDAVNGIVGMKPLDLKTSPGFPYIFMDNTNGKHPWFNVTGDISKGYIYHPKDELLININDRINKAHYGIMAETYFVDQLKDETREIQKVIDGKTRVFQLGPMDLTIAMRMYFGEFVAHFHLSSSYGECAIGVNANSYSWTYNIKRLLKVNNKFGNGDYKNYDASISQQIALMVADIANEFYDDGEINANVRRVFMLTCVNRYHIVDVMAILFKQGNPSGCLLTSIFNVICNMMLKRHAYKYLTFKDLCHFNEDVSSWDYGDDNLFAISNKILDQFNMYSYANHVKLLGFEYTSVNKDGTFKKFYELEEVSFLKRKFVKHNKYGLYKACLELDVINEIPRWSESDPENMEDQLNRFNSVLKELANYGKEHFNNVRKYFLEYCNELGKTYSIKGSRLFSYEYAFNLNYPNFGIWSKHLDDLNSDAYVNFELLHLSGPECNLGNLDIYISNNSCTDIANEYYSTQIICQMDQDIVEHRQMEESKERHIVVEKITTFEDQDAYLKKDIIPHEYGVFNATIPVDLSSFLERPYIVNSTSWSASAAQYSILYSIVPWHLLLNNAVLNSKILQIQLFKADIEVSIRINTTKLHYGRLMYGVYPGTDILPAVYKHWGSVSSFEWYQIDANGPQTLSFIIPYRNIQDMTVLCQTPTNSWACQPGVTAWIAVPLSSAIGVASTINVDTYCRFVNSKAFGYVNRAVAQMDNEQVEKNKKGFVVSDYVRAVGDFVSFWDFVPVIGSFVKPVSQAVMGTAKILKRFGYSIPNSITTPQPIFVRSTRALQAEDVNNAHIMTISQDAGVQKDHALVNGSPDEVDIVRFCQRPFLIYTGQITNAISEGTYIYFIGINPFNMYSSSNTSPSKPTTINHGPLGFTSRMLQLWRGGIRFHISFICSSFQSVRVRAIWDPTTYGALTPSSYDQAYTSNFMNIVMDVNQSCDYSFTVPYMQDRPWLPMANANTINDIGFYNGYFCLQILNPLTSGYTSVNPIYFQVFTSAASDYQVAAPSMANANSRGYFTQMDSNIAEKPYSSFRSLQEMQYPSIGGIETGRIITRSNTATEVTSLRQLCNMLSRIYLETGGNTFTINVNGTYTMATDTFAGTTLPNAKYNYLLNIMSVFFFHRGGIRLWANQLPAVSTANGGYLISSIVSNYLGEESKPLISASGDVSYWTGIDENRDFTQGFYFSYDSMSQPLDIIVPYYSFYNCNHLQYALAASGTSFNAPTRVSIGGVGGSVSNITVFMGCADDFTLGCQIGIPDSTIVWPA